jgi:sortase A
MEQLRSLGTNVALAAGLILLTLGLILSMPRLTEYVASRRYPLPRATTVPAIATAKTMDMVTATATPTLPSARTPTPPLPLGMPTRTPSPSTPTKAPTPTPTARLTGTAPIWLRIPAISLDAPVMPIGHITIDVDGEVQSMWNVPDWRAVGWHETSALIGAPGNTVLNGHNTTHGEVFRDLYKVEAGALLLVDGEVGQTYAYRVAEKIVLPENGQPLEVRRQNARHIQPTADERLTLVTCHPYGSLANRLLVIAYPAPETDVSQTEDWTDKGE